MDGTTTLEPTLWERRLAYHRARDQANDLLAQLRQAEQRRALSELKALPPQQRQVLGCFAERDPYCEYGYSFSTIGGDTGLGRPQVCRACRALARLGFLRFIRGLWTEDGEPRGSGYSLTKAGLAWWNEKEFRPTPEPNHD